MVNVDNLRSGRAGIDARQSSASSTSLLSGENLLKIVEEILNKPSLTVSADKIRKEIVKFFKEGEKEGVETQSFKLSLLDPLSRKRIRIPVRSVGCDHFQCFDLHNFLEFSYGNANNDENRNNASAWRCPHCQTEAKQEQLRIDGYFQEILMKVGPMPLEVEIFPDGQWKEVEQIDFKDVLLGAMDNDGLEIVEMVPKKKPRILEQTSESNGICAADTPLPDHVRCEETKSENLAETMQELKRDSETVDALCEILSIDKNGGEKRVVLIETVRKLLSEKEKKMFDFETNRQEKAVENLPEQKKTKAQLMRKQKRDLHRAFLRCAIKRRRVDPSADEAKKAKGKKNTPKEKSIAVESSPLPLPNPPPEKQPPKESSSERIQSLPPPPKQGLKPVDHHAYKKIQELLSQSAEAQRILEKKKKFPGHKLILMSRSSVLRSLFLSNDKNRDEGEENAQGGRIQLVELPDDVEPANFEQFLRFCYTDHVDFTRENVAAIYQLAHHYDVPLLEKRAVDFICDGICFGNSFEALDFACEHSEYRGADKIRRWALWTIRNETREALYKDRKDNEKEYTSIYSEGFLKIGREALRVFASHSDLLPLDDFEIFRALIHWALYRQRAAGFQAKSLRETLGPALHAVKFSRMSLGEFARVMELKVLTDAEAFQVFKRLSGAENGSFSGEDLGGGPSSGFVPKNKFDEN